MKNFQGKVAVVTGAASGIGRALAGKSAQEGMKVVLADVEEILGAGDESPATYTVFRGRAIQLRV